MARSKKGKTLGVRLDGELAEALRRFVAQMREKESTAVRVILRDRLRQENFIK